MLVLGIDTALKSCSAAILRDGERVGDNYARLSRGHAEILPPMAAAVCREAGVALREIDRVGVVVGPGGFAGVRVGLAFARGLALGTTIKVIGMTSLAALAAGNEQTGAELTAVLIDARRDQVYAGLYGRSGEEVVAPFVAAPKEALEKLADAAGGRAVSVVGDGAGLILSPPAGWVRSSAPAAIDPAVVARFAGDAPPPAAPPAPLYLRAPDAKPPGPSLFDGLAPV